MQKCHQYGTLDLVSPYHWDIPHIDRPTIYPKKYAHGFCFAVLCCGNTLTDFPISIRLTSLALWESNDCPSVSKATLMNMDKYFMWIHFERLHNHNKAKHNKTVCIFLGISCSLNREICLKLSSLFTNSNVSFITRCQNIWGCLPWCYQKRYQWIFS